MVKFTTIIARLTDKITLESLFITTVLTLVVGNMLGYYLGIPIHAGVGIQLLFFGVAAFAMFHVVSTLNPKYNLSGFGASIKIGLALGVAFVALSAGIWLPAIAIEAGLGEVLYTLITPNYSIPPFSIVGV